MSRRGSDEKVWVANKTCWLLTMFTASLAINITLTAVGFVVIRNMQNDIADLQGQRSAASETKEPISDMLSEIAADKEKRSVLSPTSSSRLAVDVGSLFVSTIKSMCKPEGAVCIPGAKGEAGQPGRDGLPGVNGLAGRDGEPGDDGLPGRDGLPGTTGATGRDGPMGIRGVPGKSGAKGMGLPGKQGPIGIPGGKGDKGERGEKGGKGDIGGQGIQGVKGIQGEKGGQGDRGEQGYTGYKGGKGERGMTGEKGMRGEKGNKGIRGEKGEKGKLELPLPSQCKKTNHRVLSDNWRKVSSPTDMSNIRYDRTGHHGFQPGWHVFASSIGGQMPETCSPINHCGTLSTGWLNGSHPTVFGQTSKETVCFHWDNNCCHWQTTVDITHCLGFYVYNLPSEPCGCSLAYCSDA